MKSNTMQLEHLMDQEEFDEKLFNRKEIKLSDQGFEGKPNFPKLDIRLPEDLREMETPDGDW